MQGALPQLSNTSFQDELRAFRVHSYLSFTPISWHLVYSSPQQLQVLYVLCCKAGSQEKELAFT